MVLGFLKAVSKIIILSSSKVGQSVLDGLEAVLKIKINFSWFLLKFNFCYIIAGI